MTPAEKRFILGQLKAHHNMSLATVRRDGYPQATTVAYANDVRLLLLLRKLLASSEVHGLDFRCLRGNAMQAGLRAIRAIAAASGLLCRRSFRSCSPALGGERTSFSGIFGRG